MEDLPYQNWTENACRYFNNVFLINFSFWPFLIRLEVMVPNSEHWCIRKWPFRVGFCSTMMQLICDRLWLLHGLDIVLQNSSLVMFKITRKLIYIFCWHLTYFWVLTFYHWIRSFGTNCIRKIDYLCQILATAKLWNSAYKTAMQENNKLRLLQMSN